MKSGSLVPASRCSVETRISNSKFITTIAPAFTVAEAKAFIKEIKQLYADASHNVPVYQIGSGSSVVAHCSDNGEPSGTAGRPALAVLKGSDLSDTVLVITRYFGGTKLGTGGLVKAYSNAAKSAINAVPKAKKVLVHHCQIICPYSLYEQIARMIRNLKSINISEEFTEIVSIDFSIPEGSFKELSDQISELSNGQIQIIQLAYNQIAVLPIT
jgi:uncharacterized YigZ family protein